MKHTHRCPPLGLLVLFMLSIAGCSGGSEDGGTSTVGESTTGVPIITTSSLNQVEVNTPVNVTLAATGAGPFSWQVTNGTLPVGLTLQSNGTLTGMTTQEGQFPFTVRVTGAAGTVTKDLKLVTLGTTHRISVVSGASATNPLGEAHPGSSEQGGSSSGDGPRSFWPSISGDGRYIVFDSAASNLVPEINSTAVRHIYLHDRQTGLTEMISVASSGAPGNKDSFLASVSDDGNIVVFDSFASNLVPGDTNDARDVFVRNRVAGTTLRISQLPGGAEAACPNPNPDCNSFHPSISADGAVIAFGSIRRLAAGDTDDEYDVYLFTGSPTLTRLTAGAGGSPVGGVGGPKVSADGRLVAFASTKENLVPGDVADGLNDIFVYEIATGVIKKVTGASGGGPADGESTSPSISGTGRFVAFASAATNLLAGVDSNAVSDIFVADLAVNPVGIKRIINLNLQEGDGESRAPSISRDGKVIAFDSLATNFDLTVSDNNGARDIYVIDRSCSTDFQTGPCTFKRASVTSNGDASNGNSIFPALCGDAKYVTYFSDADNLIPAVGDGNGVRDGFVTKRQ